MRVHAKWIDSPMSSAAFSFQRTSEFYVSKARHTHATKPEIRVGNCALGWIWWHCWCWWWRWKRKWSCDADGGGVCGGLFALLPSCLRIKRGWAMRQLHKTGILKLALHGIFSTCNGVSATRGPTAALGSVFWRGSCKGWRTMLLCSVHIIWVVSPTPTCRADRKRMTMMRNAAHLHTAYKVTKQNILSCMSSHIPLAFFSFGLCWGANLQ